MSIERALLALLLGGVAVGCALILAPFVSALLWAAILVFTTWPVNDWLRVRLGFSRAASAGLMVALVAVVIVLPLALAAPASAADANRLRMMAEHWLAAGIPPAPGWVRRVPVVGETVSAFWDHSSADLSALGEALRPYFGRILQAGFSLLLGVAGGVVSFGFALFAAFFFYVHAEPIAERMRALLRRIAGPRADRLIAVTGAAVRGTVYGLLGTAVMQGVLTGLGLWACGVPRPLLLGAVAGILSLMPIGAPMVWIPAALWLASEGWYVWAAGLAAYGVVAISGADSVIRPMFISRGANLPFLLTVLGVLGGAVAFGLLGIFLGPVVLGVGYTLVLEFARDDLAPAGTAVSALDVAEHVP